MTKQLMRSAILNVERGPKKGAEFALIEGVNLIGRWDPDKGAFPEVDLEVHDPEAKVSRRHAIISIEPEGKIIIEDVGSLNGTFINRGERLKPGVKVELKDGDEIVIGKTFLRLLAVAS
ncbi:FHA domain-containing protein [bacterium]|nr:FHA domain-containing protein [bacterium]